MDVGIPSPNNHSTESISSRRLLLNQNADDLRKILNIPRTNSNVTSTMAGLVNTTQNGKVNGQQSHRKGSIATNRSTAKDSISSSSSKTNEEWVRNSLDYVRRRTFEEMARRSRDWKRLKSSEWSACGQWLFFAGFVLLFSCLGTLIWKLAYIDFFLYKMNEDKQFINHDLQQIIEDERSGRNYETDYEPIIRRTCSNANIRFILSLIICCILSAVGFLLICCGLSGITVEVEEGDDNAVMYDQLRRMYAQQDQSAQSPDSPRRSLIQGNNPDTINTRYVPSIYPIFENSDLSQSLDSDSLKSARSHLDPFDESYPNNPTSSSNYPKL